MVAYKSINMDKDAESNTLLLHKLAFFDAIPSPINAFDYDRKTSEIALARENGMVEVWNVGSPKIFLKSSFFLETGGKSITKCLFHMKGEKQSILLSSLNGMIYLKRLNNLEKTVSSNSFGGEVRDIFYSSVKKELVAACQDGCARIFSVSLDKIEYKSHIAVSGDPLLSVYWEQSGSNLMCGGSDGLVTIWNYETKKNTHRFTVGPQGENSSQRVSINCLASKSNLLISGDSSGTVSFWDITTGTQLSSFRTHSDEVNSVYVIGKEAFSAGVDSKVVKYKQMSNKTWTIGNITHSTSHAINEIRVDRREKKVYAVGLNGNILSADIQYDKNDKMIKQSKKKMSLYFRRHRYFTRGSDNISLVKKKNLNLLLIGKNKKLSLWLLAKKSENDELDGKKVLSLETTNLIVSCCLSPDGKFIAFCDTQKTYLMEVNFNKKEEFENVKLLDNNELSKGYLVRFSKNNKLLVVTDSNSVIEHQIENKTKKRTEIHFANPSPTNAMDEDAVVLPRVSAITSRNNYFVVCDISGKVSVYLNGKIKKEIKLRNSIALAATISADCQNLFLVLNKNRLFGLDINTGKYISWFNKYSMRIGRILSQKVKEQLDGISASKKDPKVFFVYSHNSVIKIDISKPPPPPPTQIRAIPTKLKTRNMKSSQEAVDSESSFFSDADNGAFDSSNLTKFTTKNAIFFENLDENSAVVVKMDVPNMIKSLPKPIYRHKFSSGF